MAEIEITGKQIGQLDALAAIDGSEKIPVETADGNGHVTTQQMREYAQPDLGGYATKSEVAEVKGSAVKGIMFAPGPAGNGMDVSVVRTDGSSDYDVAEIPLATTEKCGLLDPEEKKVFEELEYFMPSTTASVETNRKAIASLEEAVAGKADAPVEFREPYEALRIKQQPDVVIEGYFGCSKSTADLLIIQFSNDASNVKTKWRRMTEFIPADEFQFTLRDDGTYLYVQKNYGGGMITLHVMTRGAEPLEAITIKSAEIPAEATYVAEAPSYEDFITEAEADGKYATKEELEAKAADIFDLQQAVAGKVTGTGVSAIEVVTELPAEPQDGVMYVVMG